MRCRVVFQSGALDFSITLKKWYLHKCEWSARWHLRTFMKANFSYQDKANPSLTSPTKNCDLSEKWRREWSGFWEGKISLTIRHPNMWISSRVAPKSSNLYFKWDEVCVILLSVIHNLTILLTEFYLFICFYSERKPFRIF